MEPKTVILCLMRIFNLFGACGYIHSDSGKSFLSREFVPFMHKLRIPTSKTSVYHPTSNGQCEKYNDVIWSGVKLALKEQNFPITKWVCVTASPSLCARHNRLSKYNPQVEEADLIHATPQYAHVRFRNGRETTVSLRDVAPLSGTEKPRLTVPLAGKNSSGSPFVDEAIPYEPLPHRDKVSQNELETSQTEISHEDGNSFSGPGSAADNVQPVKDNTEQPVPLRRSTRTRKSPERLMYRVAAKSRTNVNINFLLIRV